MIKLFDGRRHTEAEVVPIRGVVLPPEQRVHEAAPGELLYQAIAQSSQPTDPVPLLNLPSGHKEQDDAPLSLLYEPALHGSGDSAPSDGVKLPAVTAVQAVRPVSLM